MVRESYVLGRITLGVRAPLKIGVALKSPFSFLIIFRVLLWVVPKKIYWTKAIIRIGIPYNFTTLVRTKKIPTHMRNDDGRHSATLTRFRAYEGPAYPRKRFAGLFVHGYAVCIPLFAGLPRVRKANGNLRCASAPELTPWIHCMCRASVLLLSTCRWRCSSVACMLWTEEDIWSHFFLDAVLRSPRKCTGNRP